MMDESERRRLSKFLSFVLRHEPDAIGLELDVAGWASVDSLLEASCTHGAEVTRPMLEEVVATSPKRRFVFSDDGQRIRAAQGHSIDVDLNYLPTVPPDVLFHGTVETSISVIRSQGLLRLNRHDVHLSIDAQTALCRRAPRQTRCPRNSGETNARRWLYVPCREQRRVAHGARTVRVHSISRKDEARLIARFVVA